MLSIGQLRRYVAFGKKSLYLPRKKLASKHKLGAAARRGIRYCTAREKNAPYECTA